MTFNEHNQTTVLGCAFQYCKVCDFATLSPLTLLNTICGRDSIMVYKSTILFFQLGHSTADVVVQIAEVVGAAFVFRCCYCYVYCYSFIVLGARDAVFASCFALLLLYPLFLTGKWACQNLIIRLTLQTLATLHRFVFSNHRVHDQTALNPDVIDTFDRMDRTGFSASVFSCISF